MELFLSSYLKSRVGPLLRTAVAPFVDPVRTNVGGFVLCAVVVCAVAAAIIAALLLLKQSFPTLKKSTTTKKAKKTAPICPFTKDTNFVVEMAETVPIAPLEESNYDGPIAARWLAYGISGQDSPGRLRAGLKRLRDSTYFLVEDKNLAAELSLKERNLTNRRDICFVMEDSSLPAQREVLDLFLHHLPHRYPDIYTYDAKSKMIHVKPSSTDETENRTFRIDDYAHAPLELCERIVQEDLILMRPDGTTNEIHSYHMAAAAVVFSFVDLAKKLGQPAEFIHAPVPHFQEHIQKSFNLMLSKLSSEKPLWRNNWGIARNGTLDEPFYGTAHAGRPMETMTENDVKQKYLKVEYQTIRRLRTSNYLLFTVKTMVNRMDELERVPVAAACLASSIRGMSTQMHRYKGVDNDPSCQALLQYLDSISSTTTATTTANNQKG